MKDRGGDGDGPHKKHARRVGAGLSLDKFASAGVSKYDKRKKIERLKKQKLIQHSKLGKLKKKLAAQGVLAGGEVKDSIAELEALDGIGSGSGLDSEPGDHLNEEPHSEEQERQERVASHAHAGPKSAAAPGRQGHAQHAHRGHEGAGAADEEEEQEEEEEEKEEEGEEYGRGLRGQQHKQRHGGPAGAGNKRLRDEGGDDGDDRKPVVGGGSGQGRGFGGRGGAGRGGDRDGGRDGGRGGGRDGGRGRGRGGERLSTLQRLAQKVSEQKAEEQQAKEAARKEREERQKRLAAAEKVRKEQKHLHFKRNAKGQPLMRFRMEKLLGQIEKGG
ncbi:hypothetical protein CHLRE_03g184750v5 [Chlamydomonas reinhardtii]|uniref:rRNA-processing protein FYV7 n=1 Tax=Chlamydomonas reinhardtii TaxID=3055 RepID=A0A2K3DXY8_CHLRE|nr:uncharacterized protein CHLRE_03g184750v5 [Chlamydomonas reinhardtii]PNW85403.1 hypothetical protein CHLRE_03g184750v5 [Chlamydomonas reinhardtii]